MNDYRPREGERLHPIEGIVGKEDPAVEPDPERPEAQPAGSMAGGDLDVGRVTGKG
ncbi:MAG: hypothetical protein ACREMV_10585 [Gemmatimonadales bacterium]